jgi:carboxymethylenebutenolidase
MSDTQKAVVVDSDVLVPTPDGEADGYWVHPASGAHAAVFVWPDIMGVRPAFHAMGKRLAESGYAVLVVNPYYRSAKGRVLPQGKTIRDPGVREQIMPHRNLLSPETCVRDGRAIVTWLDAQPAVDSNRKIGVIGYCMTGSYAFRLAAAIPERIGAGGCFHGGGLVTDADDSPHRLIGTIEAGMLVAIAENDDAKDPEAKTQLRAEFDRAGVSAEMEVYDGALHGWCPPDSPAYNPEPAERAWERLLLLLGRELA